MPWKNNDGRESLFRPDRVRLPDGMTRTGDEITDQQLADAGWRWEPLPEISRVPPYGTPARD